MTQLLRRLFKADFCLQPIKYATLCNSVQFQRLVRFHSQQLLNTDDYGKSWTYEHKLYLKTLKGLVKRDRNLEIAVNRKVISVLCKAFKMDESICKRIVKQKYFETCSVDHITTMSHLLNEINVTSDHLIKAPWLLWLDKEDLISKLTQLKQPNLFQNEIDGLGFIIFSSTLIDKYSTMFAFETEEFEDYQNRIYYIADKLNLPIDFFTIKLVHVWKILHLGKERIDAVITMLKEFNISPMEIVNDAWVFLHTTERMRERLSRMRDTIGNDDIPLKLWFCRCSDFFFERALDRQKKFQTTRNLVQILEEDLGLTFEECTTFVSKGFLNCLKTRTIENKIHVYKKAGMSVEFLKDAPFIFLFSEKRVLERWKIFQEKGIALTRTNLTLSEERFKKYISR